MSTGPIDLHTHSSVSDGTETPADLIASAVEAGLGTVALTDHDSTAGWGEAAEAVRGTGLSLVPGMELSTRIGMNSVHMLGYLYDPASSGLLAVTERLRDDRLHRAERMVARIGTDYDLVWDDVLAQASVGATLGRPHIADALVAKGYARDRSAAFAGILHWRSGYYEPHEAPNPLTGVRLIREAGGVPVLAHPATRGREPNIPRTHLLELIEAGLAGFEIGHRARSPVRPHRHRLERLPRRRKAQSPGRELDRSGAARAHRRAGDWFRHRHRLTRQRTVRDQRSARILVRRTRALVS
jgi:predicted metal-dependent phosphoesterase TrpH